MNKLGVGCQTSFKRGNKITNMKVIDSNMIMVSKHIQDGDTKIKVYEGVVKWEKAFTTDDGADFYGYESTGYDFIFEEEKSFSDIMTKDEVVSRLSRYRISL